MQIQKKTWKSVHRWAFSLGDKEANTRNTILKTVEYNTRELSEYFKNLGSEVIFELNPGNHFTDTVLRSAKGIKAILQFLKNKEILIIQK